MAKSNGSIKKRGNGQFQLTVSAGFDGNGNRNRYYKTITTTGRTEAAQMKEARFELSLFVAEIDRGECAAMGYSKLNEFADYWMKEHVEKNLAPKTAVGYRSHLKNRILPALGNIRLKDLTPLHIVKFFNALDGSVVQGNPAHIKKEGSDKRKSVGHPARTDNTAEPHLYSGKSQLSVYRTLSSMLKDAVQWGLIPFNPCERTAAPKVKKKKITFLNEKDVPILMDAIDAEPLKWKVALYIALFGGLRRGEIAGLEWHDVDYEKNTIKIKRNSQYVAGLGVITKAPKTDTSGREIAMHSAIMDLLRQHQLEEKRKRVKLGNLWDGAEKPEMDRILTQWNGHTIFPDSLSQWFSKLVSRLPLSSQVTFHGLRHSSATHLLAKGISIKNISSRLGHADTNITLALYSHALESVDRLAADAFGDMIPGSKATISPIPSTDNAK